MGPDVLSKQGFFFAIRGARGGGNRMKKKGRASAGEDSQRSQMIFQLNTHGKPADEKTT